MKYTRQDIIRMRNSGELTPEEARAEFQALLAAGPANKPKAEPPDPMARVADELSKFAASVQAMNQAQAEQTASILRAVLALVNRKIEVNVPDQKAPVVNIDRPIKWKIGKIDRDRTGKIESAEIEAAS